MFLTRYLEFLLIQVSLNMNFQHVKPVPLGAGIISIIDEPHFPFTLKRIECEDLQLHCQDPHPLLIFIIPIFAFLNDFSLAGTVSFAFPYPTPIKPSRFPTTANEANLGLLPSGVFFCVCLNTLLCPPPNFPFDCPINNKSFSKFGIKASTISASIILKPPSNK